MRAHSDYARTGSVGVHTNERTDDVERDNGTTRFAERIEPGSGVRVIAVEKRAVVEKRSIKVENHN
jgi:hypothetical protein